MPGATLVDVAAIVGGFATAFAAAFAVVAVPLVFIQMKHAERQRRLDALETRIMDVFLASILGLPKVWPVSLEETAAFQKQALSIRSQIYVLLLFHEWFEISKTRVVSGVLGEILERARRTRETLERTMEHTMGLLELTPELIEVRRTSDARKTWREHNDIFESEMTEETPLERFLFFIYLAGRHRELLDGLSDVTIRAIR